MQNKLIMRFKSFSIGFGTVFSLIVAYFIYLYANEKGWKLLAFASKAYIIVYVGIFALIFSSILLMILLSFLLFRKTGRNFRVFGFGKKNNTPPKQGRQKQKEYIDAEYEVKE